MKNKKEQEEINKQFCFKMLAKIYAKKMEIKGYKTHIHKQNWYMLGGWPWNVNARKINENI